MRLRDEWPNMRRLKYLAGVMHLQYNDALPPLHLVTRALDELYPEDVRVVILGQDPYHTEGKASGLAFGYHRDYKGLIDSSLHNIRIELTIFQTLGDYYGFDRTLENWAKQGVLLLNTRLTVSEGRPMSHANMGWEQEILEVLKFLNGYSDKVLYVGWGSEAQKMLDRAGCRDNRIDTSHPCRFSYMRGNKPFFRSNCFQRINKYLRNIGSKPINWIDSTEGVSV